MKKALPAPGVLANLIDGDNAHQGFNSDLGLADAEFMVNIRRVAELAKLMIANIVVSFIILASLFQMECDLVRELFEGWLYAGEGIKKSDYYLNSLSKYE